MAYTPDPTWVDGAGGSTPITAAKLNHMEAGIVAAAVTADVGTAGTPTGDALRAAFGLVVAATVTASGALVPGKHNPVDATAGAKTMTLPTGAVEGAAIGVEKLDSSTNTVTVTGNIRGASGQSISLPWAHETLVLRADSTGSWWPVAGHKTKATLDASYAPYDQGRAVVVEYTTTTVVTLPTNCLFVDVALLAGGGGGGSGRRGAAGTVRCGGGGGGVGGSLAVHRITAADVPSGQLTVNIGGGGAAGAAVTTDNTDGSPGAQGGTTSVTTVLSASTQSLAAAYGGGQGQGGTNSSGAGGVSGVGPITGATGGAASATGGAGGDGGFSSAFGSGAGGAGGGITSADVAGAGGRGGGARIVGQAATVASGGVVDSTAPGNSFRVHASTPLGAGAGGGAASKTTAAQQGGSGSGFGVGGSGGGASLNGFASGAGRAGAQGWARLTFYIGYSG